MSLRALLAELLGTFGLTLAVFIGINNPAFPVPVPVIAGLTLGLFVYTIGPISGCHINPAVTIGLLSIGKVRLPDAAGYIVVQFVGAGIALAVGNVFFPTPQEMTGVTAAMPGFAELFGTAIFLFGIASVVLGRVPSNMSGIVIGGSLLLGISLAAHRSAGVLNPAVAFGIGSFTHPYIWGPVVGAILGAMLSNLLSDPDLA